MLRGEGEGECVGVDADADDDDAGEEGEVPGDGEERLQAGRGPQADLHRALEQV